MKHTRSAPRFLALSAFSFLFNLLLVSILHETFRLPEEAAYAISLVTVFFLNFLALRYLIYGKTQAPWRNQLTAFFLSSIGFRGLEYLAFVTLVTWAQWFYLYAIVLISAVSILAKYLFYGKTFFQVEAASRSFPEVRK